MIKLTPVITIWQLKLKNDFGTYRREFFLTKKGLNRYLKKHKKELEQPDVTWYFFEHLLWLW